MIEQELTRTRTDEKRLMALLSDKGAGPEAVARGTLSAMLRLEDKQQR